MPSLRQFVTYTSLHMLGQCDTLRYKSRNFLETKSHLVAQGSPELTLSLPAEFWDYRGVLPCLATSSFFMGQESTAVTTSVTHVWGELRFVGKQSGRS